MGSEPGLVTRFLSRLRVDRTAFLLLVAAFVAYCGIYIFLSSFVIGGHRYFVLFDDAMVSMQYARNLAQGNGLVWNAGAERVEGYSSLLWVVWLALLHFVPLAAAQLGLLVQLSGVAILVVNLVVVKKIAEAILGREGFGPWLAAGLTAFYYPLITWTLLGNEVGLLTLFVGVGAWLAIRTLQGSGFDGRFYLAMAISLLVRMDALVPYLVLVGFLAYYDRANRARHLRWTGVALAVILGGQTLFRWWYYGDILPNTFYLKMTGFPLLKRVVRGAYVFTQFVWRLNWVLFALPFIAVAVRRKKEVLLLLAVFAAQAAYSVYIGGDAWEHRGGANRFLAIAMPVWFVAFAWAVHEIQQGVLAPLRETMGRWAPSLSSAGWVLVTAFCLLNFNILIYPSDLKYLFLRQPSIFVIGNQRNTEIGLFVNSITREEARIAVVAAGAMSYFADRYSIDILGKSDRHIARLESPIAAEAGWTEYRPGHVKWDYAYVLQGGRPDVFVEVFRGGTEDALPFLQRDYIRIQVPELSAWLPDGTLYLRSESSEIEWEAVEKWIVPW